MALFNDAIFHERLTKLRESNRGLDGTIIARGGDVKFHLSYLACCNDFLYNKITNLLDQGQNQTIFSNTPHEGVEQIIKYCYSGEIRFTRENFAVTIDAALAMEFKEVAEYGIAFADMHAMREQMWAEFLTVAFKYQFETLPANYMPNLILGCIHVIPKHVFMAMISCAQCLEILKCRTLNEVARLYLRDCLLKQVLKTGIELCPHVARAAVTAFKDLSSQDDVVCLEEGLSEGALLNVLEHAANVQCLPLLKACLLRISDTLPLGKHVSTILKYIQLIRMMPSELTQHLKWYVNQSMPFIKQTDISEDDLCSILDADWINVPEFELFQFSLEWLVRNNAKVGTKQRVFGLIRYGLMTSQQVHSIIFDHVREIQQCLEIFMAATRYHVRIYKQPFCKTPINKLRKEQPLLYIVGGINSQFNRRSSVEQSGISELKLSPLKPVPDTLVMVESGAGAVINGFLFMCGGAADKTNTCLKSLYRFDPRINDLLLLSPMSSGRKLHTCTAMNNSLVVVGGFDGKNELFSVEIYTVTTDTWRPGYELSVSSSQHAACAMNNSVYISGGTPGKSVQMFDGDTWSNKQRMNHHRQLHCMESVGLRLFVVGGVQINKDDINFVNAMESYDTTTNQWTELSPLQHPCAMACSVVMGNSIMVIGGMAKVPEDSIQKYSIDTDQWELCDTCLPFGLASGLSYLVGP